MPILPRGRVIAGRALCQGDESSSKDVTKDREPKIGVSWLKGVNPGPAKIFSKFAWKG